MGDKPPDEEIEAGRDELIMLRYSMSWPVASVEWTRRRRSAGSQSFPLSSGAVSSKDTSIDWTALRSQALEAAGAGDSKDSDGEARPKRSLFSRLLTRS